MKRANNLYPLIPLHENLREAFRKAAKGKQTKLEVVRFRHDFENNIRKIREQLIQEEPDIGHYRFFTVRDPKTRTICAASFPERVLHHAIMNVCEPYLDAYAIYDSYACRKGKGNRKAIERARRFSQSHAWYLKLDIRKYFDSIDHGVLMASLARRFKDSALLSLFEKILDTYRTTPGKGVPIGNLISQHLANFYLGVFDHWVKEKRKIKGYLRYMDDFILFSDDRHHLKIELEEIHRFLENRLALELKENVQINRCERGVPFLGFRVFPCHVRLSPRSLRRFSMKLRVYEKRYCDGLWSEKELVRHVDALNESTRSGDSACFRRLVIERFGVLA